MRTRVEFLEFMGVGGVSKKARLGQSSLLVTLQARKRPLSLKRKKKSTWIASKEW